jgi:hypothetical protein
MAPAKRMRLVQVLADALPETAAAADCSMCGGEVRFCDTPRRCIELFAEHVLGLVERELERTGDSL